MTLFCSSVGSGFLVLIHILFIVILPVVVRSNLSQPFFALMPHPWSCMYFGVITLSFGCGPPSHKKPDSSYQLCHASSETSLFFLLFPCYSREERTTTTTTMTTTTTTLIPGNLFGHENDKWWQQSWLIPWRHVGIRIKLNDTDNRCFVSSTLEQRIDFHHYSW